MAAKQGSNKICISSELQGAGELGLREWLCSRAPSKDKTKVKFIFIYLSAQVWFGVLKLLL